MIFRDSQHATFVINFINFYYHANIQENEKVSTICDAIIFLPQGSHRFSQRTQLK